MSVCRINKYGWKMFGKACEMLKNITEMPHKLKITEWVGA